MRLKEIVGLEGYFAGSDGHIYSSRLAGRAALKASTGSEIRRLAAHPNEDGYLRLNLRTAPYVRKEYLVHRLIAMAFHGPPKRGQVVRHRDGSRTNNVPRNIRWGTHLDNARDRDAHKRTAKSGAKLTEDIVRSIRVRLSKGESRITIQKEFGMCSASISNIVTGKTWKT